MPYCVSTLTWITILHKWKSCLRCPSSTSLLTSVSNTSLYLNLTSCEFTLTPSLNFKPYIDSLHPHLVVDLSYCLAKAGYFPEELIRAVFCVDFLRKLDSHLESRCPVWISVIIMNSQDENAGLCFNLFHITFTALSKSLSWWTRLHLMKLNRAVCIECPEFQVPWFHEEYCKFYHHTGTVMLFLVVF